MIEIKQIKHSLNPSNLLPIAPYSCSLFSIFTNKYTSSFLLPILPLTSIYSSVFPCEFSVSLFFIPNILSFISSSIRPNKITLPIHFVLFPKALIFFTIMPDEMAITFQTIILELSFILAILCFKYSMPFFFSTLKIAFIFCAIWPFLLSIAVLRIVIPFSCVGSIICFEEYSSSFFLAQYPFSFIDLSVRINHSSLSMWKIARPISFIYCPIDIDLPTSPITIFLIPLPVIDRSIIQYNRLSFLIRESSSKLIWAKLKVQLSDYFWASFRQILIIFYFRFRFTHQGQIGIGCSIDTFAGLAVSHLNYKVRQLL